MDRKARDAADAEAGPPPIPPVPTVPFVPTAQWRLNNYFNRRMHQLIAALMLLALLALFGAFLFGMFDGLADAKVDRLTERFNNITITAPPTTMLDIIPGNGIRLELLPNGSIVIVNTINCTTCFGPPAPSGSPSLGPSFGPSFAPSTGPSFSPTRAPTTGPSAPPTPGPSSAPSGAPTSAPSGAPSAAPTGSPSGAPSGTPTNAPSGAPTSAPSNSPTRAPSAAPSDAPSAVPTFGPSAAPTGGPTTYPTQSPTDFCSGVIECNLCPTVQGCGLNTTASHVVDFCPAAQGCNITVNASQVLDFCPAAQGCGLNTTASHVTDFCPAGQACQLNTTASHVLDFCPAAQACNITVNSTSVPDFQPAVCYAIQAMNCTLNPAAYVNIYTVDSFFTDAVRVATVAATDLLFDVTSGSFSINGPLVQSGKTGFIHDGTDLSGSGTPGTMLYKRVTASPDETFVAYTGDYLAEGDDSATLGFSRSGGAYVNTLQGLIDQVILRSGDTTGGTLVRLILREANDSITLDSALTYITQAPPVAPNITAVDFLVRDPALAGQVQQLDWNVICNAALDNLHFSHEFNVTYGPGCVRNVTLMEKLIECIDPVVEVNAAAGQNVDVTEKLVLWEYASAETFPDILTWTNDSIIVANPGLYYVSFSYNIDASYTVDDDVKVIFDLWRGGFPGGERIQEMFQQPWGGIIDPMGAPIRITSHDTMTTHVATFVANETFQITSRTDGVTGGISLVPNTPTKFFARRVRPLCVHILAGTPTPAPAIPPTPNPTTGVPSGAPSVLPTRAPTASPSTSPTQSPTFGPTNVPTLSPSPDPTQSPTLGPTANPTQSPTVAPTDSPTTGTPTTAPTQSPTFSPTAIAPAGSLFFFNQYTAIGSPTSTFDSVHLDCPKICGTEIASGHLYVTVGPFNHTEIIDWDAAVCDTLPICPFNPTNFTILDEGVLVEAGYQTLNFTGGGVVATDDPVPGVANVLIPGVTMDGTQLESLTFNTSEFNVTRTGAGGKDAFVALVHYVERCRIPFMELRVTPGLHIGVGEYPLGFNQMKVTTHPDVIGWDGNDHAILMKPGWYLVCIALNTQPLSGADTAQMIITGRLRRTNVTGTIETSFDYGPFQGTVGGVGLNLQSPAGVCTGVLVQQPNVTLVYTVERFPSTTDYVVDLGDPTTLTVQALFEECSTELADSPPSSVPTAAPTTGSPSSSPTGLPTFAPTAGPTAGPTRAPTGVPSTAPTNSPTFVPSFAPTNAPTGGPTASPTQGPTASPTTSPTAGPTDAPTTSPTVGPSAGPTAGPTDAPTTSPTGVPSNAPSSAPSFGPTAAPTFNPTTVPTGAPTFGQILVDQCGVLVGGLTTVLNFCGAVNVTDAGSGQVNVTIPSGAVTTFTLDPFTNVLTIVQAELGNVISVNLTGLPFRNIYTHDGTIYDALRTATLSNGTTLNWDVPGGKWAINGPTAQSNRNGFIYDTSDMDGSGEKGVMMYQKSNVTASPDGSRYNIFLSEVGAWGSEAETSATLMYTTIFPEDAADPEVTQSVDVYNNHVRIRSICDGNTVAISLQCEQDGMYITAIFIYIVEPPPVAADPSLVDFLVREPFPDGQVQTVTLAALRTALNIANDTDTTICTNDCTIPAATNRVLTVSSSSTFRISGPNGTVNTLFTASGIEERGGNIMAVGPDRYLMASLSDGGASIALGRDSALGFFVLRRTDAGGFMWYMPEASTPQIRMGSPTMAGSALIDAQNGQGLLLNTVNNAPTPGRVVIGDGGLFPETDLSGAIGSTTISWGRGFIQQLQLRSVSYPAVAGAGKGNLFQPPSGCGLIWQCGATGETFDLTSHDNATGYVANQHFDHTTIFMNAGAGITGGGNIAANRTFAVNGATLPSVTGFNDSVCTALPTCANGGAAVCNTPEFEAKWTPGFILNTTERVITWSAIVYNNYPSIISHNGLDRVFIVEPGSYQICYYDNIATGNTGVTHDAAVTITLREDSPTGTTVMTSDMYTWAGPINGVNVRVQDEAGKCVDVITTVANKTYLITIVVSTTTGSIIVDSTEASFTTVRAFKQVCTGGFAAAGGRGRLEATQPGAAPTPAASPTVIALTQHIWAPLAATNIALGTASDSTLWSEPVNGRILYSGTLRHVTVTARLSVSSNTVTTRRIQIALYKNGIIENGSIVEGQMPATGTMAFIGTSGLFNITSGDYFETWGRDIASGDDMNIYTQLMDVW